MPCTLDFSRCCFTKCTDPCMVFQWHVLSRCTPVCYWLMKRVLKWKSQQLILNYEIQILSVHYKLSVAVWGPRSWGVQYFCCLVREKRRFCYTLIIGALCCVSQHERFFLSEPLFYESKKALTEILERALEFSCRSQSLSWIPEVMICAVIFICPETNKLLKSEYGTKSSSIFLYNVLLLVPGLLKKEFLWMEK